MNKQYQELLVEFKNQKFKKFINQYIKSSLMMNEIVK